MSKMLIYQEKEGSNANLGHANVARDDRVKKLDCMTSEMFPSRTLDKDLSNKNIELKEGKDFANAWPATR